MKKLEKIVKAKVEGEDKETKVTVSLGASLAEAVKIEGEEKVYAKYVRMTVTDACNAERVALKGGEARLKRKKIKELAEKLLGNDSLMSKVQKELGITL